MAQIFVVDYINRKERGTKGEGEGKKVEEWAGERKRVSGERYFPQAAK